MLQDVDLAETRKPMFLKIGGREIVVMDAEPFRAMQDAALSARPAVGEDVVVALSQAIPVEIKDDAGWSLSFNFGRGEAARDKMRAVADAVRARAAIAAMGSADMGNGEG